MFVSFRFEFRNFFNSRHHSKVGGNSDSRQCIAIRRSLLQNMHNCEKQQNYYLTSTSRKVRDIIDVQICIFSAIITKVWTIYGICSVKVKFNGIPNSLIYIVDTPVAPLGLSDAVIFGFYTPVAPLGLIPN